MISKRELPPAISVRSARSALTNETEPHDTFNYKGLFTKEESSKSYVETPAVRPWRTMKGKIRLSRFYENLYNVFIKISLCGVSFMKISSVTAAVYSMAWANYCQYSPLSLTGVNCGTGNLNTISWSNRALHENWSGESHALLKWIQCNFSRIFSSFSLICTVFGATDFHKNLISKCQARENRYTKGRTFLIGCKWNFINPRTV